MNPPRPSVSVVIPCYCYGRFLEDCVRSALDQEGVDIRVLIIDDASPDDSADVAVRLAEQDARVEVRRHRENRGHIATYNEGLLEWADGDYSILISADDLLTPGCVARAAAVLDAHPDIGMVYGHALKWIDTEPKPVARRDASGLTIWPGLDWLRIVCRLGHSVVTAPEVVVRTSVQKAIGGYLHHLPHTGDLEMWMRFALNSDIAFIKGADQAYYRIHGANMTVERVPIVDLRQRKAAYDAIFESFSDQIPDAEQLRREAGRSLAKDALWEACRSYHRRPGEVTQVPGLREFAAVSYPHCARLPEYWGLRWRQLAGPDVSASLRPIMMSAVRRRLRYMLWSQRWKRQGV
ncbi:MAG: glycosyltransferase family 2 protein [Solirubrobacteraceae bacterium]